MNATELLQRVRDAYANASTFRDRAELTHVHVLGPRPWDRKTSIFEIETVFDRRGALRYECRQRGFGPPAEWSRGAAWSTPEGLHAWSTFMHRIENTQDFAHALSLGSGTASLCGTMVPAMLHPCALSDVLRGKFADSGDPVEEDRNGVPSLRLDRTTENEESSVWVDPGSALVLRFDEKSHYTPEFLRAMNAQVVESMKERAEDDESVADAIAHLEQMESVRTSSVETEDSIVFSPEIDVDLEPGEFLFEPPA